jgi:hypothetical protein
MALLQMSAIFDLTLHAVQKRLDRFYDFAAMALNANGPVLSDEPTSNEVGRMTDLIIHSY